MTYDYYAYLAKLNLSGNEINENGLVSGSVDECTVYSCKDKIQAQDQYRKLTNNYKPSLKFSLEPDFSNLPMSNCLGIEVEFKLQTPWYSKDDRQFHVMDNPVRKDRVLGVPYMPASSWKGLLRWACRMQAGFLEDLEQSCNNIINGEDETWITHLFGNQKEEEKNFNIGTLAFFPTWFQQIDFEVINPHSRKRKAGRWPIYYEVVPKDSLGCLQLLYAPLPDNKDCQQEIQFEALNYLVQAINYLLETYGISAKRTVGWGAAEIKQWKGSPGNGEYFTAEKSEEFATKLKERFTS